MKKTLCILSLISLLSVAISFNTLADAHQEKDTIDELFEVTQADKMVDTMYAQMGSMFDSMRQQMGVKPEEMPIFEKYNQQMISLLQTEVSWAKMSPDLKVIYSQNFTEAEIQALLKFYKSPVGQTFIEKTPIITQQSMQIGQQAAMKAMPQIQELAANLQAELAEFRAQQEQ